LENNCLLFDRPDAALMGRLRAMQAFADLNLHSAAPLDGAMSWRLRGVPRHDDLGAFAGFIGQAQALDEGASRVAEAAALAPLLNACPAAAVVAIQQADGAWRVGHSNAAARLLWPQQDWPASLDAVAALLPLAVGTAVRAAVAGGAAPAQVAGWRVERCGEGSGSGAALVLSQLVGEAGGMGGASGQAQAEADSFSFTASHDLRAPIRVVEGFTRIVKEDYGHLLDRVGNDHLERVLGAAARMNLMIDALLTLARLSSQPLARQPVNLSQLAGYVVDELQRAAPGREADIDIEPGLSTLGDPTLLRLVLENLLGNAWKYSGRTERTQISFRCVPHDSGHAYVVQDNGAGFDMRSADRLFGLFQRLHSASEFPGHGVGLASVRRIVNRHGGEIWAESEAGRGAAFYFTLAG
jgi:signal transduction histidine kinase